MMIRSRTLVLASLLLLSGATPLVLTSATRAPSSVAPEGPLEEAMQGMQANLKALDKAVEAKDLAKVLTNVVEMQKSAHEAKQLAPAMAAAADAKEKEKITRGFRLKVIELERALLDLETAAVEGKLEDVKHKLDAVKAVKKAGHDAYKKD